MGTIADFSESELWLLRSTLRERYGEELEVQLADSEMRIEAHSTQLHTCPAAYWERDKCHFIVVKTGADHYSATPSAIHNANHQTLN